MNQIFNEENIEKLKQNVEIPEIVLDRAKEAYQKIETGQIKQQAPGPGWLKGIKIVGGMAAVFVLALIVCIANPVMAEKLPLVGNLFSKLQNQVSFQGNFSDQATTLEKTAENEAMEEESLFYSQSDGGMTVTLSEIYANDQACYITVLLESEKEFPDNILIDQNGRPVLMMQYALGFDFTNGTETDFNRVYPEGVFIDDYTYSCILRISLDLNDNTEYLQKYDEMVQEVLDEMGITMDELNDETEEGYRKLEEFNDKVTGRGGALLKYIKKIDVPEEFQMKLDINLLEFDLEDESEAKAKDAYEGNWSYEIPVHIDNTQTTVIEINETNENGIGLESVIKTPYEITVNELYEEGSDSDTFMVALDADGNKLPYNDSDPNCNNFTIQDRDISKVDIYILDYITYMDELKGEEWYHGNENRSEEEKWGTVLNQYAKYHKTVYFQ